MKEALLKLHLSVLIAGGTGVFGRLITLGEGLLVWYRLLLATLMFYAVLFVLNKIRKVQRTDVVKIASTGVLLAMHWLFFYGSIKASNVSIGVVCLSLMSFFTALFDPLINRRRISIGGNLVQPYRGGGHRAHLPLRHPLPYRHPDGRPFVGIGFALHHLQQARGFGLSVGHGAALRDGRRFRGVKLIVAFLPAFLPCRDTCAFGF